MVGVNHNNNLNVLVFEVGFLRQEEGRTPIARTVAIHPFLVAPTSWSYTDAPRDAVEQTFGGATRTGGGRALRSASYQGSWGVEVRGIGPFVGSGELRAARFHREVVRLGSAPTLEAALAEADLLTGSPNITRAATSFNPDRDMAFVNVFDLFKGWAFECILTYQESLTARGGGASGLRRYSLQVQEVGPVVVGGLGSELLNELMLVTGTWTKVNDLIDTASLSTLIEAGAGLVGIPIALTTESVTAVAEKAEILIQLLGGAAPLTVDGSITDVFAKMQQMTDQIDDVIAAIRAQRRTSPPPPRGALDLAAVYRGTAMSGISTFLDLAQLQDLREALSFNRIAGVFSGMSEAEYRAFVEARGEVGLAPTLRGSQLHHVSATDTAVSIVRRYGVSWRDILALNGLMPDEALVPGVTLQIPEIRQRGPQGSDGIATFDSHAGTSLWGRDLALPIEADDDGDLKLVEGEDCLAQGVRLLMAQAIGVLYDHLDVIPPAAALAWMKQRLAVFLVQDPRIRSVSAIEITPLDSGAGHLFEVTLIARNGEERQVETRI